MSPENYHHKLFPVAYNILGSSDDAKDAVQDVLVKFHSIEKGHIENETGFLIKSTVNHAINIKTKKSRTLSTEVWLPEPVSTENSTLDIDKEAILSYSLLILLEKLSVKERAVFILREAFEYSHMEIADTLDFSIENSRQLLSRAKHKLSAYKTHAGIPQVHKIIHLERYVRAIKSGDTADLEKLLSKDISLAADGGESIRVVRDLTTGIAASSKLLTYVYKAYLNGLPYSICEVNHQPAILFHRDGLIYNCQVFELREGKIQSIYSIVDPEKLKSLCK